MRPNVEATSLREKDLDDLLALRPERPKNRLSWVIVALLAILVAMLIRACVTQPSFQWRVVAQYFFNDMILRGVVLTVELTLTAMCIGIVLGTLIAIMRLARNRIIRVVAGVYIWFFRAIPALVQLIFWYNLAALFPTLGLGIPFGPVFVEWKTNDLITPIIAANLGLGLSQAAYTAEVVRGGIIGVDWGQIDAAVALGMRRPSVLRKIVLPQALPMIIPPIGNEVIGMLKYTSLASVIAVTDLLASGEIIYTRTFQTIPILIVCSLWYLVLTTILTGLQTRLERHAGKSRIARVRGGDVPLNKSRLRAIRAIRLTRSR